MANYSTRKTEVQSAETQCSTFPGSKVTYAWSITCFKSIRLKTPLGSHPQREAERESGCCGEEGNEREADEGGHGDVAVTPAVPVCIVHWGIAE